MNLLEKRTGNYSKAYCDTAVEKSNTEACLKMVIKEG